MAGAAKKSYSCECAGGDPCKWASHLSVAPLYMSQGVSSTFALQSHAMRVIAKANLECEGKSKAAAPHRLKKEGLAAIEQWLQIAVDLKICAVPCNTYNRSKTLSNHVIWDFKK